MKYVAFSAECSEWESFETFDDAQKWLMEEDFSEGFPDGFESGQSFIAEVTHVSAIEVKETRMDYPCKRRPGQPAECSSCTEEGCDGTDEWPYGEFDWVGNPVLREVRPCA